MPKTQQQNLGDAGEKDVCRFLENNGCKILETNWLKPWGELDIVAEKRHGFLRLKKTIIFVEVKTLKGRYKNFKPEDNFTEHKKQKFIRIAQSWLISNNYSYNTDYRLDLAAVETDKILNKPRIRYYKNAIA